jgi:hypothetical protein
MDHIPGARDTEDIEITPERIGLCSWEVWDLRRTTLSYELDYGKGVDEREEIVLGIVQEWLFFGVLEQFGEIFDESGIERLRKIYHHSLIAL